MRNLRRLACATIVSVAALASGASGAADTTLRRPLVVYYASETTRDVVKSENYRKLVAVLRASPNPEAAAFADDIVRDAERFPGLVERDVRILLDRAKVSGYDLAVFSNTLAAERRYLHLTRGALVPESRPLPNVVPAANAVLESSPLSRADLFTAALRDVLSRYPAGSVDVLLIVSSHGSRDMAIMPRVHADLSRPRAAEELAQNLREGEQAQTPEWAVLQGTGKVEFWKALAEVTASHRARFPLVIRAACASGLASWQEYLAIPRSVGAVAHTNRANVNPGYMAYGEVVAGVRPGADWVGVASAALQGMGLHVDSRNMLWMWPAMITLQSIPRAAYFAPLAALLGWLAWVAVAGRRARSRAAAERAAADGRRVESR